MNNNTALLYPGEEVQHIFQPKLSVYLLSVLIITALTTVVFSIAIVLLAPFIGGVAGDMSMIQLQLGVVPIAFLMALGFHSPLTWLRARNTQWLLTNMTLILRKDGDTMRFPLGDIQMHTTLWPWTIAFSLDASAPYTIDYIDLNRTAKTTVNAAVQKTQT